MDSEEHAATNKPIQTPADAIEGATPCVVPLFKLLPDDTLRRVDPQLYPPFIACPAPGSVGRFRKGVVRTEMRKGSVVARPALQNPRHVRDRHADLDPVKSRASDAT